MTSQTDLAPTLTWPFWAPTPDDAIERALDLAGVGPGCHLLDLGCGDGRVLEAAVKRGARATGYEGSPQRAQRARDRLAHLGDSVNVIEADFHVAPLEADVIFAFLSPAVLCQLRPRFENLPEGSRIVTYGYGVFGWRPDRLVENCFLYTMPSQPSGGAPLNGWRDTAFAVVCAPGRTALVAEKFGAVPGPLAPSVSPQLASSLRIYLGTSAVTAPENRPVDIVISGGPNDEVLLGSLILQGRTLVVCLASGGDSFRAARLDQAGWARLEAAHRRLTAGLLSAAAFREIILNSIPGDSNQ